MIDVVKQLVGVLVTIKSSRNYDICFNNDAGGTMSISGTFRVKVTKQWHDDETGWRFVGTLVTPRDRRVLAVEGATTPQMKSGYQPDTVYFSNREIQS